jgi:hypothetical protein
MSATAPAGTVLLLTGNDLLQGHVLWWDGAGWSRDPGAAVPVLKADGEARIARELELERVNDLALVEAEQLADGGFRLRHVRERIRAYGPTVRPDLALGSRDWR